MFKRDRIVGLATQLVVLGAVLATAGAASAGVGHTYPLVTGVWARGDGIDVDVPFVGRQVGNCDFIKQGQNKSRATGADMTDFPNMHPSVYMGIGTTTTTMAGMSYMMTNVPTGFMVRTAANYGCLSGSTTSFNISSHATGAALTLPTHLLQRPGTKLVAVPIPDAPALVQAATSADWFVPHSIRAQTVMDQFGYTTPGLGVLTIGPTMRQPPGCIEASCTNLPPLNRLHASAWRGGPMTPTPTFMGQSGRAGADFTWCPGLPGCTTINQIGATDGMIVKYKAGPNRFGGTIAQIVFTHQIGSLFINLGGSGIDVQQLDAGAGAAQATGRGYADFLTDYLMAATKGYTMVTVMKHFKTTLDTSVTLIVGVGNNGPPMFPAGTNQKWGFPLTTGTVVVRATNNPVIGNPVVTITGMGYDKLLPQTSGGNPTPGAMTRQISLVAGGVANLSPLQINTSTMGQMFLPEPSRAGQLFAGVLGLLAVAGWRARAQRR